MGREKGGFSWQSVAELGMSYRGLDLGEESTPLPFTLFLAQLPQ